MRARREQLEADVRRTWARDPVVFAQEQPAAKKGRIWRKHGLKPHLVKTFKLSRDPQFVEKLEAIVGLYLNSPAHALALCCDEKSQIQALDCTQPGLPLKPGRAGTLTHDDIRNGLATLFAALNVLDGTVTGVCLERHRHQEWLWFLRYLDKVMPADKELHLIATTTPRTSISKSSVG